MRKIVTDWETIFILLMVCSTNKHPLLHYTNEDISSASIAVLGLSTIIIFTFVDESYISYRIRPKYLIRREH